jgi:hypothetical protein
MILLTCFPQIVVMVILACHIASASLMGAVCTKSISPSNLKATTLVTHLILGIFCSIYFFELCKSNPYAQIHWDVISDLSAIVMTTIIHAVRLHSTGRLVKALTHGSLFYVSVLLGAFNMSTISVLV